MKYTLKHGSAREFPFILPLFLNTAWHYVGNLETVNKTGLEVFGPECVKLNFLFQEK